MVRVGLVCGLLLAALATRAQAIDPAARKQGDCPDVSGHFRVAGSGDALTDALAALRAGLAAFPGSEVVLSHLPGISLSVRLRSGAGGRLQDRPNTVLLQGTDFSCSGGWLVFKRAEPATRRTEQGWHEGRSVVSIAPGASGGLSLDVRFSGSQRNVLYQYDSARISLPKLGTGITLSDSMRWPDLSEPGPALPAAIEPPAPEPGAVIAVRKLLKHELLGPLTLGPLVAHGGAVRVTLTARRSDDVFRFEDRLHAASIAYEVLTQPIWQNNSHYLQLLVWPPGAGAGRRWRPSAQRVQHELRHLAPMAMAGKVSEAGGAYLAAIDLVGAHTPDAAIARLKAGSSLFDEVEMVEAPVPGDPAAGRSVQLRLRLR